MGLSDPEREVKLYYCIYRINEIIRDWEQYNNWGNGGYRDLRDDLGILKDLKRIPQEFFRNDSNSFHWFAGSNSVNSVSQDHGSPWNVVIGNYLFYEKARDNDMYLFLDDIQSPADHWRISNLLQYTTDNRIISYVFEVYQVLEAMVYALRRYQDKFVESYKKLDDLIGTIYSKCFNFMEDHKEEYGRAYLINRLADIVWDTDDVLCKIIKAADSVKYQISCCKLETKAMIDIHVDLLKVMVKDDPQECRKAKLFTLVKLSGKFPPLMEEIRKNRSLRKYLPELEAIELPKKEEKPEEKRYRAKAACDELGVYRMYEELPKRKPSVKKVPKTPKKVAVKVKRVSKSAKKGATSANKPNRKVRRKVGKQR